MLAVSGTLPEAPNRYAFEFKWDGVRCIFHAEDGVARLVGRGGSDITSRYPEVAQAAKALGTRRVVLDGEIVALDSNGKPSFPVLQERMHERQPSAELLAKVPVSFFAFDVLEIDGNPVVDQSYEARRRLLEGLGFSGPHWLTTPSHAADGRAMQEASRAQGIEGVVAKALGSKYRPGTRSDAWIKVKNRRRQEFVVGGWTRGQGLRSLTFGALLLGYYQTEGSQRRLVYAGRVGTGFDDHATERLEAAMRPLRRTTSPFAPPLPPGDPVYLEPRLAVEVEFAEWTPEGILRHSSFLGLRTDIDPNLVEREPSTSSPR